MRSRLQQLLGQASPWVLQPQRSALACLGLWLLSLPLTWQQPWLALLGFTAVWGLTVALWLEAPLLQALPLPPLTVLFIGLCLRWGLGPLFLALGGSGGHAFVEIWIRYGPPAQLLWLSLTAALLLLALPQRRAIAQAARALPQASWSVEAINQPRLRAQLTALGVLLSLYMAVYITLSVLSGAFDRQVDAYMSWTQQLWRLDTPVAAFSRLRDLWFLLFPLWWRLLNRLGRWVLGAEMLAFLAAALLSGSRGLLFYPFLLLLFGLWFVLSDPRRLRCFALALAVLVLVLSPLIYVVRESSAFQRADSWTGRLQSIGSSLIQPEPLLAKARWLGRDLYACHDPYLFTPENRDQPLVGSRGLGSLVYLWVPKHVLPDQPVLFDGHLIAKQLQRVKPSPLTQVWFPCFSLPADLMRRWSVLGLLLGSLVVAAVVQVFFRLWYRSISVPGSTFQILVVLLPATYLQSFPFGTVSETAWALLWELPKYLFVFWVIGTAIDHWFTRAEA
ncbi:hypothetical protein MY494_07605 [Synechococcus sp. A10-1-5-1]|uniref:hypothetical protein n=1 Tax=Synechococcus sp. A10-1-5-1 TaxID=2936507 RepID=UPI0020006CB5|nr:hypothetical protein [Synechococcus sp. A10-1-5-1]UPM49218.1 hypothetical protein MY494_07605 [Synechococcus sp. A10-1-5-1]